MILQALLDLARREDRADPHFDTHRVDFVIRVTADGGFLALEPTADASGRAKDFRVPRVPIRTVAIKPAFLQDKAQYVLGLGQAAGPDDAKKIQQRNDAFREMVRGALETTEDPGLAAVDRFLSRLDEHLPSILEIRPDDDWTGGEWLAFELDGDGELVHERAAVMATWVASRDAALRDAPIARCLVSGEIGPIARLHGKVKLRLRGSQSGGSSLVSFNERAFESFEHEQGENAPIGTNAAAAYVGALNYLLERTETRIYRCGVRLGSEAVTVFWTRERHPDVEPLASFFEPSRDDVVRAAESPFRGLPPSDIDDTAFYALTLGGNAARVVVRDWFTSTMTTVKQNLRRYFEDLALGSRADHPIPIAMLVNALRPPGRKAVVAPDIGSRLFRAALRGQPFPREILASALRRLRVPPDKNKTTDPFLHPRCALIKAVLTRLPGARRNSKEITVSLSEDETRVPYLLGRLFAVLEKLQGVAQGSLNATIRDRYFGSASATPAVVFPRLLRLSVHHTAKAEGLGVWLEKTKGSIIDKLPACGFPAFLQLEEQGLFAIGYYHQRESFFSSAGKRDATSTK